MREWLGEGERASDQAPIITYLKVILQLLVSGELYTENKNENNISICLRFNFNKNSKTVISPKAACFITKQDLSA